MLSRTELLQYSGFSLSLDGSSLSRGGEKGFNCMSWIEFGFCLYFFKAKERVISGAIPLCTLHSLQQ